jgi:DNA mismatch endonuclease, patch repair protein
MADIWSKEKRSEVMGLIRSGGNKATELSLIRQFRRYRITGWQRKQHLLGRPDFVFRKQRVCIFVDGCFWHGCPRCYRRPSSNQQYWDSKVERNRARDRMCRRELRAQGWRVVRIWEHDLALNKNSRCMARLKRALQL